MFLLYFCVRNMNVPFISALFHTGWNINFASISPVLPASRVIVSGAEIFTPFATASLIVDDAGV